MRLDGDGDGATPSVRAGWPARRMRRVARDGTHREDARPTPSRGVWRTCLPTAFMQEITSR